MWSKVQQSLHKNIFNFIVKYLNNTLASRKNLYKWYFSDSPSCSFCLPSETLQHIVSSYKHYLGHGRYNWRHDSLILYLSRSLSHLTYWSTYADLPSLPSPCLITGDSFRPDLILYNKHNINIHILELTVGFESNLKINSDRKLSTYRPLKTSLSALTEEINFINMSMSTLGVLESSYDSLIKLLNSLDLPEMHQKHLVSKVMAIAICSTYYISCRQNKDLTDPELMDF